MYTIKEAAARTGVPIALLRAWERRYGVVAPTRTSAGYRLYDDEALDRVRTMRQLVADGWQPSGAAAAILAGTAPVRPAAPPGGQARFLPDAGDDATAPSVRAFLEAAAALDAEGLERALDEMFAAGSFEVVADRFLLPALVAIGDAWADGRVSVAGEHAASQAVHRRLAAAFQAAGRSPSGRRPVLVGLPPGSRHELGALAFAVAARRAGVPVLYLGPDLPVADWTATVERTKARAVVIAAPTAADVERAVSVIEGIAAIDAALLVAIGGNAAPGIAEQTNADVLVLPRPLVAAVDSLRDGLSRRRSGSA